MLDFRRRNGDLQRLRVAARAVRSHDGEPGGSLCGGCAADLTGARVQVQIGRQSAVGNAPYDGRCAARGQRLAVRLTHPAVHQTACRDLRGLRADRHHDLGADKVVSVLRIAHEVIARGQIFDLAAGAGCVGALLLRAVFHSDIHTGNLSVASALRTGCGAPQSGGCALPGSFDAPSRRYSVGAAVRPLAGPGRDHDRIAARIRTGVAGDVHACIDAPHIGGLLRAVIDIDALHTDIRPLCRLNRLKLGADGDIRARLGEGIRLVLAPTGNALAPVLNNGQRLQQIPLIGNHRKHHPIALIEQGRAVPGGFRGIRHRDCAVCAIRYRQRVARRARNRHGYLGFSKLRLIRMQHDIRTRQVKRSVHGKALLPL